MSEYWTVYNKRADFHGLAEQLNVDPVLVRVMRNRELLTLEQMQCYLGQSPAPLYDADLLKDCDKAVGLLTDALNQGLHIRIISDYDVDGMMSNYVLYQALQTAMQATNNTAFVDYTIPHRMKDGYGLSSKLIEQAHTEGVEVILTCDNGIAAIEAVALAKTYGMTVIVTDHHEPQDELPTADAIVNPKQPDCTYPFPHICGAVVAYKVMERLFQTMQIEQAQLKRLFPYIAIATVCDVMPLVDENRTIVKEGIAMLQEQMCKGGLDVGLNALIEAKGVRAEQIKASTFGFTLGPCLNASGRLATAEWGLKLLLETDARRANWRAKRLTQLNEIRQQMSKEMERQAYAIADSAEYQKDTVLVLYLPKCHESIAGIVAGRLREYTGKPSIVLTDSKTKGIVKGSGRSIPEYDMFAHLLAVKDCMTQFGGHKLAAGLSLYQSDIARLRTVLNAQADLNAQDIAVKRHIDLVMPLEYVSLELIEQLTLLEPCGMANSNALFAARDVVLANARIVGQARNVLKMTLLSPNGGTFDGVYFGEDMGRLVANVAKRLNQTPEELLQNLPSLKPCVSILYRPQRNEYRGNVSIQLKIIGIQ